MESNFYFFRTCLKISFLDIDIMYLLTEWEGRTGKYLARSDAVQMTESQIFSRTARPNSVNKHFIIWPNQKIN